MFRVGTKPWVAESTEASQMVVFGCGAKKLGVGGCIVERGGGHAIYEIDGSGEDIRPIGKRHGCMSEEGKACFSDVTVSSLRISIVFRGMRRRGEMRDAM